jgi:hypothetical protein
MIARRSVLDAGTADHRCRHTTWQRDLCLPRHGKDSASRNGAAVGSSARSALGLVSIAAPNAPVSRSCCHQA